MATRKYRCFRECFAYNKRFKKGEFFPPLWLENGYKPQDEYFVLAEDYDDAIRTVVKQGRQIVSAGDDPRPTAVLVEELKKYMEVPKDWNRKRIWMALVSRDNAEAKTEPRRGPGRPAAPKEA